MIKGKNNSFWNIAVIILSIGLAAAACNSMNPDSSLSLVDEDGKHLAGWIEAHGTYAEPDGSVCTICHGDDLDGGIANVSCSSASYNGQSCHGGGPAFHPPDWVNKSAFGNTWHADAFRSGLPINGLDCVDCHTPPPLDDPGGKCTICHFGSSGSRSPGGWTHGISNHPQFAGSPESDVCINCHFTNNSFGHEPVCHNCHGQGQGHIVPFLDHFQVAPAQSDFDTNCSLCHSVTGIQPNPSARPCDECHTSGSPYTLTNCQSCHGNPPNGANSGANFPNRGGEHSEHVGDQGFACTECHNAQGSGSGLDHYEPIQAHLDLPLSFTQTSSQVTCNGTCHDEVHDDGRQWY
jgi:hypothetical protein